MEVIVVDNASSDGSVEMIRSEFPQVRVRLNKENLGFAKAINPVLQESSADYFLLLHPDTLLFPEALQVMRRFLEEYPRVGVVGGNLLYPDGTYNPCRHTFPSIRTELTDLGYRLMSRRLWSRPLSKVRGLLKREAFFWDHESPHEGDHVWNACLMFRREVLETVGGFCEDFFVWFADADWCRRVKTAGWKIYYLPEAKAIHYERQSKDLVTGPLIQYKVNGVLVRDSMAKDQYTFLRRYYKWPFLTIKRSFDTLTLILPMVKLILGRLSGAGPCQEDWTRLRNTLSIMWNYTPATNGGSSKISVGGQKE